MISKYSIRDFYDYIESTIVDIKNTAEMQEKSMNSFSFLPREKRRSMKENITSAKNMYNKTKTYITDLTSISKSIDSDVYPLNTERQYSYLIISIFSFLRDKIGQKYFDRIFSSNDEKSINIRNNIINNANEILSYFVKKSKNKSVRLNFLNSFLDDGKYNIDKFDTFERFIEFTANSVDNVISSNSIKDLFISNELLESVNQRKKERLEEKQRIKEEKKNNKFREKSIIDKKQESVVFESKPTELSELEKDIYSNYIDERSMEIKSDIVSKISLKDFLDLISGLDGMSKKRLEYYANEYNNQFFGKQLDKIYNLLSKEELQNLKNIFSIKNDVNNEICRMIYEFVISEDYLCISEEDIRDNILELMDKSIEKNESNDIGLNFVVFPNETLFDDELNTIINISKSGIKKEFLANAFNQQITYLRTQNIEDMYSRGNKAFHEIKNPETGKGLIIKGNLKGYRYGNKRPKVSIFRISVSENNKRMLKERYNLKENPDVLLSFSLGFVPIEEEHAMYIRSIKNAKDFEDKLDHIANLFKTDFTDETFKEACYFIDMSLDQIKDKSEEMVR